MPALGRVRCCYRKIEFRGLMPQFLKRFAGLCRGCLLPAELLKSELFFVRVNRFWCIWMRVLACMKM